MEWPGATPPEYAPPTRSDPDRAAPVATGLISRGPRRFDPFGVGPWNVTPSGGVAPGYYLAPLQGTKNLPFGLTPRHRVSDITASRFPLSLLGLKPQHFPSPAPDKRLAEFRLKTKNTDTTQDRALL